MSGRAPFMWLALAILFVQALYFVKSYRDSLGASDGDEGLEPDTVTQRSSRGAPPRARGARSAAGDKVYSQAQLEEAVAAARREAEAEVVRRLEKQAAQALPSSTPRPPTAPAGPANPWITTQLCHTLPDETELCQYTGPVCVNKKEVVFAAPPDAPHEYLKDDDRTRCLDYRFFTRRNDCGYGGPFHRDNLPPEAYADPVKFAQTRKSWFLPMKRRTWGADDHGVRMSAVPADILAAFTDAEAFASLPVEWQEAALSAGWIDPPDPTASKFDQPGAATKASRAKAETMLAQQAIRKAPSRVKWLPGYAYLSAQDIGHIDHPYHFAADAFGLWDVKQYNYSVENVPLASIGKPGPLNYTMGTLRFPPIDYLLFIGGYDPPRHELREVSLWTQGVLPLLVQEHTKIVLNGELYDTYGVSDDTWLCFSGGGVTMSMKPRLFTSFGDANSFRALAWAAAGIDRRIYDHHPPRRITILSRSNRGLYNMSMVEAVVKATGLPYQIVTDLRNMPWVEQVRLFADTGILIAAHGGALANIIFMPPHSVVIEAHPYLTAFNIYQRMAEQSELFYYKLRGQKLKLTKAQLKELAAQEGRHGETAEDPWAQLSDPSFVYECENPHHASSIDSMLQRFCNVVSKRLPIGFTEDALRNLVEGALDDIGCRDSMCRTEEGWDVTYTDAKTGAQWKPADGPWDESRLNASTVGAAIKQVQKLRQANRMFDDGLTY